MATDSKARGKASPAQEDALSPLDLSAEDSANPPRFTIAVLDDLPVTGQLIALILRTKLNCRVHVFQTGEELLEQPPDKTPDLYLLDIMLDNGSGIDVCRRLREDPRRRRIPVVFLSAHGKPEVRVAALKAGGNDYLDKPFYPEELLVRVRAQLALHAADANCAERLQNSENALETIREELAPLLGDCLDFFAQAAARDTSLGATAAGLSERCRKLGQRCMGLASTEQKKESWHPSRFSLSTLLRESVLRAQPDAEAKGVFIEMDCPEEAACFFDAEFLRDAVVIPLLRDAVRHSFPEKTIIVRARPRKKEQAAGWEISLQEGSDEERDLSFMGQMMARQGLATKDFSRPAPGSPEWFHHMHLRLLKYGSELQVQSAPGQGRKVLIRLWDQ